MLTITIAKTELKKAFSGEPPVYEQEITADTEPVPSDEEMNTILLKIMLENYQPSSAPPKRGKENTKPKEAA